MNAIEKLRAYGTQAEIAKQLGVNQSNVGAWLTKNDKKRKLIPISRAIQIENVIGIPSEQLRPDIYGN